VARRFCGTLALMIDAMHIRRAGEYVEWLRQQVHEMDVPASTRIRAAGGCLALAQEHHHSIVFLIENCLYGSAFALVRIAFDAYVRGVWLSLCAADSVADGFMHGQEPPKIDVLLAQLEETPAFSERVLSGIKRRTWRAMCDYTHTGGLHVQRWNTSDAIEPNYDDAEILEVLKFAELIGSLSVIGLAQLAGDDELGIRVLEQVTGRAV